MSHSRRIAITGSGAVSAAGKNVDEIWDAIQNGRTAIGPIRQWDASRWPSQVSAEVTVDNRTLVPDRKLHKSIARTDMLGIYAADLAVQQSGLLAHRETLDAAAVPKFNDRTGIISGSGGGTYNSFYEYFPLYTEAKGELPAFGRELGNIVNPMWLLKNLPNNVLCHTGIRYNFKGTNTTVTNQCASGIMCVAESAAAIRANEACRMLAVGHDTPFEPETVLHFHRLGLLSDDAVRPFDLHRNGTILGEGAAAVVLENLDDARARNAAILGEFLGFGCVTEACGILDIRPDGDGVARAIELALTDADIPREEISMIVAHGNGTHASDSSETAGILRIFGDNAPPVTAFKWAYGHTIAASGVLDLTMALRALQAGAAPGIPTLQVPDPAFAPLPVSAKPQPLRGGTALVICRGFSGMNVAVIVRSTPVS